MPYVIKTKQNNLFKQLDIVYEMTFSTTAGVKNVAKYVPLRAWKLIDVILLISITFLL